jgi:hypothetical protein
MNIFCLVGEKKCLPCLHGCDTNSRLKQVPVPYCFFSVVPGIRRVIISVTVENANFI